MSFSPKTPMKSGLASNFGIPISKILNKSTEHIVVKNMSKTPIYISHILPAYIVITEKDRFLLFRWISKFERFFLEHFKQAESWLWGWGLLMVIPTLWDKLWELDRYTQVWSCISWWHFRAMFLEPCNPGTFPSGILKTINQNYNSAFREAHPSLFWRYCWWNKSNTSW